MTAEKQADIIAKACREAGLDGHIKRIEGRRQAQTWAERIAVQFKGNNPLPVKNSYMYCDTLDMSFFFHENGKPGVAYAGYTVAGSPDIKGKLVEAFATADKVLDAMEKLSKEA